MQTMSRRKMAVVIALVVIPVLLTLAYLYHRAKSVKVWDITFSAVPERTEWQADGGADKLYDKFQKNYYNALLDYGAVKNENEFYNEMHKMTSYIAREFNANNPSVTFENLPKKDQEIVVMTWFAEAGLYRKLAEDRLNHTDSWRKTYE